MNKEIKCIVCNGSGEIEDNGPKHCPKCGGNGYIELESSAMITHLEPGEPVIPHHLTLQARLCDEDKPCEHPKDCCYPNCLCNMLSEEDLENLKQERINNLLSDYPQ